VWLLNSQEVWVHWSLSADECSWSWWWGVAWWTGSRSSWSETCCGGIPGFASGPSAGWAVGLDRTGAMILQEIKQGLWSKLLDTSNEWSYMWLDVHVWLSASSLHTFKNLFLVLSVVEQQVGAPPLLLPSVVGSAQSNTWQVLSGWQSCVVCTFVQGSYRAHSLLSCHNKNTV